MTTQELVQAAARLMDQRLPGWERHVNPDTLDISNCETCILGQQPGGWNHNVSAVFDVSFWDLVFTPTSLAIPFVSEAAAEYWRHEIMLRTTFSGKSLLDSNGDSRSSRRMALQEPKDALGSPPASELTLEPA